MSISLSLLGGSGMSSHVTDAKEINLDCSGLMLSLVLDCNYGCLLLFSMHVCMIS